MMATHAQAGRVDWIGVRPKRLEQMVPVQKVEVSSTGLNGDHGRSGKRAVTLIQAEHLPVIAALSGLDVLDPEVLRRNIVVAGVNLTALRKARLIAGSAILEITGPCAPCSRMEKALGPGGFNAMRGHGGWCAQVLEPGLIQIGDAVEPA